VGDYQHIVKHAAVRTMTDRKGGQKRLTLGKHSDHPTCSTFSSSSSSARPLQKTHQNRPNTGRKSIRAQPHGKFARSLLYPHNKTKRSSHLPERRHLNPFMVHYTLHAELFMISVRTSQRTREQIAKN
jgi:hypothetical protein